MKSKDIPGLAWVMKKCSCCCGKVKDDDNPVPEFTWIQPQFNLDTPITDKDKRYLFYTAIIILIIVSYIIYLVRMYF